MEINFNEVKEKMQHAVDHAIHELKKVRTGRASIEPLKTIHAEVYGQKQPLQQVASLIVQDGQTIIIKPFDPSTLPSIESAIRASNLSFGVSSGTEGIRLTVPAMTGETRQITVKEVHAKAEAGHIAIRNIRQDFKKKIDKADDLSDDEKKHEVNELQKIHDSSIKEINDFAKLKEDEVSHI